jgi:hypothetical protein
MSATIFDLSQAMALKLGEAAAHALFCTFRTYTKHGEIKKLPIQRSGKAGVPAVISGEALFTADDIHSMETIAHGQYFGLSLNKPLHVEGRGYLVCIDVDMKHKPEGSPQHQAIKNLARWVNKVGALEELTVSGKGNHVFIYAKTAHNILRKYPLAQGQEIEIFGLESSDKKSILLTGEAMEGEVVEVDDLEALLIELGITKERVTSTPKAAAPAGNLDFFNTAPAPAQRANLEAFKAPLQAPARQYANDLQVTYLKAVEALKFISADCAYGTWIKVGQAFHDAFGDQGFTLWDDWSSRAAKYKGQADTYTHWKSFHQGGGVGIGTLFHIAKEFGYQVPAGGVNQPVGADFSGLTIDNETGEVLPALKTLSIHDVISHPSPAPAFVWDGYLPRGVVSMLAAHGGTGKSTIALMLCVATSLGRPLFGVDTAQCDTLFVSLEDSPSVVRHRLANICQKWDVNPASLDGKLTIVDGTDNPELFTADNRAVGVKTRTYFEMNNLVKAGEVGLVVVDNASDAYGGDEIQRRQVRAFIRSLMEVAKPVNCALLLLAHVDKTTSRSNKSENAEGYSGSTAWNNSVRSRLFMKRDESGNLTIEHQKSNLGRCHEPLTLTWRDGELPQLANSVEIFLDPQIACFKSKAEDDRCITLLKLIDEFASRGHFCSPAGTARNNAHAVLKSEPLFKSLRLRPEDTRRLLHQSQRANWLHVLEWKQDYKPAKRWEVTEAGRSYAGLAATQPVVVDASEPPAKDETPLTSLIPLT